MDYFELMVTRVDDPLNGPQLRIDRADPVVRLTPEFLAELPRPPSNWPATFDGEILRIRGVNRTVIYRIRELLEPVPGWPGAWDYIGEWPD